MRGYTTGARRQEKLASMDIFQAAPANSGTGPRIEGGRVSMHRLTARDRRRGNIP